MQGFPSRCGFVGAFFASKLVRLWYCRARAGQTYHLAKACGFQESREEYGVLSLGCWWPSWQRAHIPYQGTFEDDFPCPRWDMLVPWKFSHLHGLQLVFEPCHGVFAGGQWQVWGVISRSISLIESMGLDSPSASPSLFSLSMVTMARPFGPGCPRTDFFNEVSFGCPFWYVSFRIQSWGSRWSKIIYMFIKGSLLPLFIGGQQTKTPISTKAPPW